ncbi:MAG: hypothetical protein ACR2RA_02475 [Geminicoccaceae bacterium]
MYIPPSQSTLQAFGSSPSAATPAAQVRQPVAAEQVERPAPNVTQRIDAAPRADAPARPEADSRPPVQTNAHQDRPGSRVNLLV